MITADELVPPRGGRSDQFCSLWDTLPSGLESDYDGITAQSRDMQKVI
jgi:hypothetical protein